MKTATSGGTIERHRVLIVDDHPVVRVGFKTLVNREPDLVVCGEAGGVDETLALVRELAPEVVVVDLSLPDGAGLDLIRRLHAHYPEMHLLACSMHDEALWAPRVLKAGARGFIGKQEASHHVVEAIRTVLADDIYLSAAMTQQMLQGAHQAQLGSVEDLTDRELEVFTLIGQGLKTSQIAERLHLSVKTVDSHREKIKRKLNLASGSELARHAAQWTLEHG